LNPLKLFVGLLIALCLASTASAFVINYQGVDYEVNPVKDVAINISVNQTFDINQSNTTPYVVFPIHPIYRVAQGDSVYLNDTVDISGMGWGNGIAWYGKYGEFTYPIYIYQFDGTKRQLFRFWIDPSVFSNRTGMWLQYYDNKTERNGNLEAFIVKQGYRNSTLTFSNGTVVNQSVGISNGTGLNVSPAAILPERHVADYLLAIGDPLTVYTGGSARIWVLGKTDKLYDVRSESDNITIPAKTLSTFAAGTYTLLIQKPGKNTVYEVSYANNSLVSPWKGVNSVDLTGIPPNLAIERLTAMISKTDDEVQLYTLEIQQPAIIISQFDEVGIGARQFDFAFEHGLVSLMDVRGYTNMVSGTNVTAVLDNGNSYTKYYDNGFANRTSPGNMSVFQLYVPLVWDNLKPGMMHTITVTGPYGSTINADFPVDVMPDDSYRPNGSLKFVGSRNPWVPTPTPKVVTVVQTQVVTQIVTVPVTPSPEVVYAQQKKAQSDVAGYWVTIGAMLLVMLAGGYIAGRYLLSVWRRL
jgi:hypothetical protein